LTGHVTHEEAIARMRGADVLLVVNSVSSPDALTGKLFEYMAIGKPILALTGPGLLQRTIESMGLGYAVSPDDPRAIATTLLQLLSQHRNKRLVLPDAVTMLRTAFDRRALTARLAALLDTVITDAPTLAPAIDHCGKSEV